MEKYLFNTKNIFGKAMLFNIGCFLLFTATLTVLTKIMYFFNASFIWILLFNTMAVILLSIFLFKTFVKLMKKVFDETKNKYISTINDEKSLTISLLKFIGVLIIFSFITFIFQQIFIIELILLFISYLATRYLYIFLIYKYQIKVSDFSFLIIVNVIMDIIILFSFNFLAGFVMFNFLINQTLIMTEKIFIMIALMIVFLIMCAFRFSVLNSMIIYFAPLVETNKKSNKQNIKNMKIKGNQNIVIQTNKKKSKDKKIKVKGNENIIIQSDNNNSININKKS